MQGFKTLKLQYFLLLGYEPLTVLTGLLFEVYQSRGASWQTPQWVEQSKLLFLWCCGIELFHHLECLYLTPVQKRVQEFVRWALTSFLLYPKICSLPIKIKIYDVARVRSQLTFTRLSSSSEGCSNSFWKYTKRWMSSSCSGLTGFTPLTGTGNGLSTALLPPFPAPKQDSTWAKQNWEHTCV